MSEPFKLKTSQDSPGATSSPLSTKSSESSSRLSTTQTKEALSNKVWLARIEKLTVFQLRALCCIYGATKTFVNKQTLVDRVTALGPSTAEVLDAATFKPTTANKDFIAREWVHQQREKFQKAKEESQTRVAESMALHVVADEGGTASRNSKACVICSGLDTFGDEIRCSECNDGPSAAPYVHPVLGQMSVAHLDVTLEPDDDELVNLLNYDANEQIQQMAVPLVLVVLVVPLVLVLVVPLGGAHP